MIALLNVFSITTIKIKAVSYAHGKYLFYRRLFVLEAVTFTHHESSQLEPRQKYLIGECSIFNAMFSAFIWASTCDTECHISYICSHQCL